VNDGIEAWFLMVLFVMLDFAKADHHGQPLHFALSAIFCLVTLEEKYCFLSHNYNFQ
jgi:hypothetical protein